MTGVGTNLDQPIPTPDGVAYAYNVTVERIPTVLDEAYADMVVEMYTDPILNLLFEDWEACVEALTNEVMNLLSPTSQGIQCDGDTILDPPG